MKWKNLFRFLQKRNSRMALGMVALILCVIFWEEASFRLAPSNTYSEGHNAIWLRHSWVGEKHSSAEYRSLARKLTAMGITDAYFHAGPLNGDGEVDSHKHMYSEALIGNIKRAAPGIRLQAWLGQVEAGGGGPLRLSSVEVRKNLVGTCDRLLALGFDGIHIDIEPIYSDNKEFLELLHAVHKVTGTHHAILSVAACRPELFAGMERTAGVIAKNPGFWTRDYFLQVAREVDQVAVMTYDSAIPLPSLYGRSIAWIVGWSTRNGVDDLIIGIPTYDTAAAAHYPYVENIGNALAGLKQGVSALNKDDRKHVGAGIYAEWTTSSSEWQAYELMWLKNHD